MPVNKKSAMSKPKETKPPVQEKPQNPDRIDDKWRPPPTITEPGPTPETFVVGKKLGKGGFAVCFEGRTASKSEVFALKVVKSSFEQKKMMEKFRTELQIHAKMQHPNIVEFLRAFTLEAHTYVVLELCQNGNLTDMVKARSCLSLPEVRRFMIQICGGVKYLHKRSVIHRDLKMGNIFLDEKMNLKIGDFGLAAVMADETDRRTTLCGTPNYIAPEILSKTGNRGHDNKVDTWAVGVICYAMLMGTPPFQSKTQQEIYAKLRTLEYEWKIDSKNYIPQQAKDFVASCLNLVSAERPEMDDLVEHEFFTMGAIADVLSNSCLKIRPSWLENADPRGDRVQPGYGVPHSRMCNDCGVGRTAEGLIRPAVGGKANISTLVEIELENREGCAPTIPLPEGVLYKQFTAARTEWSLHQKRSLHVAKPRNRKQEVVHPESTNTSSQVPPSETEKATRPISIAPPVRPVQSFAAQQRGLAAPQRQTRKMPEEMDTAKAPANTKSKDDVSAAPNQGLLKARPLRSTSMRVTRSSAQQLNTTNNTATLTKSKTLPVHLAEPSPEPQPVPRAKLGEVCSVQTETLQHVPELKGHMLNVLPVRPKMPTSETMSDPSTRSLQSISGNRRPKVVNTEEEIKATNIVPKRRVPSRAATKLSAPKYCYEERLIFSSENFSTIPHTNGDDTLAYYHSLHKSLAFRSSTELRNASLSSPPPSSHKSRPAYPRIDKWVDYAAKKGMAYMLSDGAIGLVLRSSDDSPCGSVIIRNAREYAIRRAQGLEDQVIAQDRPDHGVEFYEQPTTEQNMRRIFVAAEEFRLDVGKYTTAAGAINAAQAGMAKPAAERMKEVGWVDKFAKYMHKKVDVSEGSDNGSGEPSTERVVRFFQRLGNVGIWGFDDGGLQFNFPDHTKLTIHKDFSCTSEDSFLVDLVHLIPDDVADLIHLGALTRNGLERRQVMLLSLKDIQQNRLDDFEQGIVKCNEVREKIDWIQAVVGCWVKNGGLGRMGEDRLGWTGLSERREGSKTKLQWVTCGRLGGDDDI